MTDRAVLSVIFMSKYYPNTAQILPWNYYQILLKKGVVTEGRETARCEVRLSERCMYAIREKGLIEDGVYVSGMI